LKRIIIIIGTALAVLVGATAAYAAFNSYFGTKVSFTKGVGSKTAPVPVGHTESWVASAPPGARAAPLIDIKTTYYGVVADGKDFPKCTDNMIAGNPKYDAACPKGALLAQGAVHALLGPANDPSASKGTSCNPALKAYNGGPGRIVFFFVEDASHQCDGLRTGATAPYDGFVKQVGPNLVADVPLPPDISNKVANQPGLYGSLIRENLTWFKRSKKVHGTTVAPLASVACKHGRRPWKVQFTAQGYGGGTEVQTVTGSDKC
jgi:hypothetical protein